MKIWSSDDVKLFKKTGSESSLTFRFRRNDGKQ